MTQSQTSAVIRVGGVPVLEGVDRGISPVVDDTGCGLFLKAEGTSACHYWAATLGAVAALDRFTACSRGESPFWMEPRAGASTGEIPGDTQWLLARRTDGRYVLLVPLVDEALRFSLDGRGGTLRLWADSGDPWTVQRSGVGAFLAVGADPYTLQEQGARAVAHCLRTCTLRRDKPLPDFVDLFDWCTWDAFYRDVSAEKVREGLESFRAGGVQPRFLVLDDGWLSGREMPGGGLRLAGFDANAKFPGGLKTLVEAVKREFGIARLLAWHAVMGYWAGVDGESLPGYEVREVPRSDLPAFGRDPAPMFTWMGSLCGAVPPERAGAFYDAFHAYLAGQGVDGVKVDNQCSLEYSAAGLGGRVRLARAYRSAMEQSSRRHFAGRLINCMSCSNEMFYLAADSALMRTSTDFWPTRPETHGAHVYTNAQVAMWFGQFVHPDWDMFQSGHPMGEYHAAARAISGSPVYVSDKPDAHNFGVLRKLVCADGTVLRCAGIARPSPDSLFRDPTREDALLKIFNHNEHGAVLGVFHARYADGTAGPIEGSMSVADVPGLAPGAYAVQSHRSGEVRVLGPEDAWAVRLERGQWDIFTIVPLHEGRAVIGLADKYNSGGAVQGLRHEASRTVFRLRDGGRLAMRAARSPAAVCADGVPCSCERLGKSDAWVAAIPSAGEVVVTWEGGGR